MTAHIPVVPPANQAAYDRFKFAPAVIVGGVIHVSGQVGRDPVTGKTPADLESQIVNVFDNMQTVLTHAGASFADVFSLNSYHVGDVGAQLTAFLAEKAKRMGEPHPAWTAVGVTGLAGPGMLLEVSALAIHKG